MLPAGLDLQYEDPAQHLRTAGQDRDDLQYIDASAVSLLQKTPAGCETLL